MTSLCRLCMGSELLVDILSLDGEINFIMKAVSCIGIQIYPNDGLPKQICNTCKEMVTIFYNFKQKCMEVDSKLRSLASSQFLSTTNNDLSSNTSENDLNIIQVSSHQENDIENLKGYTMKEKLTEDISIQHGYRELKSTSGKKFQCEICGRIFKIKAALENHILTHSGVKPFQCKLCPKRYCRLESVNIHMRSHAGIKPYVCEICGKPSTKRQDLVRHMKIHSDEKNYSCPRCNRQFKRASDVTSHMRTHTGIRPYHCLTCKKTYTSHSGLRKHYKSHCKREVMCASF